MEAKWIVTESEFRRVAEEVRKSIPKGISVQEQETPIYAKYSINGLDGAFFIASWIEYGDDIAFHGYATKNPMWNCWPLMKMTELFRRPVPVVVGHGFEILEKPMALGELLRQPLPLAV